MHYKNGFSLIELIVVITIIGLSACTFLPAILSFIDTQHATLCMRQLQQALAYARSLAIAQQQESTLCPSINRYSCGGSWQHGLLVLAPNGGARFFSSPVATSAIVTLEQSGSSNEKVKIQANGMTYSNGHFTYKSLKSRYISQFKLYFNRGLRIYVEISD